MKVVIIGSKGQLGSDLAKAFCDHEVIGLNHNEFDVTNHNGCMVLDSYKPDVVINTAAFHKTDQCEDDPLKAMAVNAIGAKNVASVSRALNATSVYISTDYVFDGKKGQPYTEDDSQSPINAYGISKLAGELFNSQNPRHYTIRVASLFGYAGASGKGGNFVETMISKAAKKEPISVIDDMWMSPTYTKDVALTMKKMLELNVPFGTYHAVNKGYCSWYQFATEIFKQLGATPDVKPVKAAQLPAKASRPDFSALQNSRLAALGIEMPEWEDALHRYLVEKRHLKK